ncbi:tripartite tricarboxylate transporter substrate binding protein [Roseococcus sp. SDR]|uniref:Bug family tripartite tricarboxylate transporter substrate binding protein n=1 Tax=Roseococcus sp. SDR TaxID=2835532 RepID=UPI001BCA738B|nr:tripartite tricarboxylate transporter substrate binding protein [Roseococcus sp. SDR]MBS7791628.1 tripartite tricarboxylate transporter substrate binding protein [Roseococcus sp. SDR]MBV1846942.1 tripartite tricarboxylate transporter substrate binding protein [Roseococcus sp. SDR]
MTTSSLARRGLIAAGLASLAPRGAQAQGFPNRSVRVIVPFPPAGAADVITRLLSEALSRELGQTLVIENRTGSGGRIGTEAAVRATPDGYTMLMGSQATNSINPELYRDSSFDPARDLVPVALVGGVGSIIYVRNSLEVRSLADLLALARRRPGELTYGSAGNGGAPHLSMALLEAMAGIRMTHVPYRGTAPATSDLLAGRIDAMSDPITTALPHVQAGAVRALAVTTPQRFPALPNLPTVAEAGVPGYEAVSYYGFFAPSAVPAEPLARLRAACAAAIADPAVARRLEEQGIVRLGLNPEQFAAYVATDRARWGRVIRDANITVN